MADNKPDCAKHPIEVPGYEGKDGLTKLAHAICNLRYDVARELMWRMADKLANDAKADYAGGREALAAELIDACEDSQRLGDTFDRAWEICKPYMETDDVNKSDS